MTGILAEAPAGLKDGGLLGPQKTGTIQLPW